LSKAWKAVGWAAWIGLSAVAWPAPARSSSEVVGQQRYPAGYFDLQIAAAEHLAAFPRTRSQMLQGDDDSSNQTYELRECELGFDLPDELSELDTELSRLALDMARLRAELQLLRYQSDIYEQPLADYEQSALAEIELRFGLRAAELHNNATRNGGLVDLATDMESRRMRLQPGQPRFVAERRCSRRMRTAALRGASGEFRIRLLPADGELWLINAFAFQVCRRRVPNAWDHLACRWNQYGTGEEINASGRYMYEVRWPDGTVERGGKLLERDADDGQRIITFRR
jgi:hypothetical protein